MLYPARALFRTETRGTSGSPMLSAKARGSPAPQSRTGPVGMGIDFRDPGEQSITFFAVAPIVICWVAVPRAGWGRAMMRWVSVGFAFLMLLTAARADPWHDCAQRRDPDLIIQGCSAIIASGRESRENLWRAYYNRGLAYQSSGQSAQAFADFNTAASLMLPSDPMHEEVLKRLATVVGPIKKLCANALKGAGDDWETRSEYADDVAEAKRQNLSIDDCRVAIGLPNSGTRCAAAHRQTAQRAL